MRALSLFAVLAICPVAFAQKAEPKYKAKPLAYWVERLQKADTDRDQAAAARAIQAFGPDATAAIPTLLDMLDDRSPEFRNMVAGVLCSLGPDAKSAVPELIKLLKEKRSREPRLVMEILGFIGPEAKDAVPLLIQALDAPDSQEVAMEALCNIGPASKESIPKIGRLALETIAAQEKKGNHPAVSPLFLNSLHKLGPDVVPLLVEMLDRPGSVGRTQALRELVKLGPAGVKAAPRVAPFLKHETPEVRLAAAVTLWKIERSATAVSALVALLKGEKGSVIVSAAEALGEIGPDARKALPELKELLKRMDGAAQAAKAAIEKIEAVNETKN